jgi:hypothetical protein
MSSKIFAGRKKSILAMLILFGPAFLLIFISTRGCEHKFKELANYGPADQYTFVNAAGEKLSYSDFTDKIVLVSTLQLTCPDSCAVSFWHLDKKIYQNIRTNDKRLGDVRMISFVTDGKGHPVKDLGVVQDMLEDKVIGYNPDIWILATGDAQSLFDFEHNGQSLLQTGDAYFGGHAFQELMLLLDKKNDLRMVLSGKTEGMIRRMFQHVALLKKEYAIDAKNNE